MDLTPIMKLNFASLFNPRRTVEDDDDVNRFARKADFTALVLVLTVDQYGLDYIAKKVTVSSTILRQLDPYLYYQLILLGLESARKSSADSGRCPWCGSVDPWRAEGSVSAPTCG